MKARLAVGVGALTLLTACFPDPGTPTNHSPVISSFAAFTPGGPSPVTTALGWTISDADNNPLTCKLDLDNNGTYDQTVSACTSSSLRTASFTTVGVTTVKLQVTDGTSTPATATTSINVSAPDPDQFNIDFRFEANVPPEAAAAFEAAASRWEAVIKTGLADTHVTKAADQCWPGFAAVDQDVDDLLIIANVSPLAPNTIAQAASCDNRPGGLPRLGDMEIATDFLDALVADPQFFNDVVTHEMGHVLGFDGGIAQFAALQDGNDPDRVFTGKAANGIYQALGGAGQVPMENLSHWSAAVFGTSLIMNPFSDAGTIQYLGALTAASLADIGYGVDLAGADPYALPSSSSVQAAPSSEPLPTL